MATSGKKEYTIKINGISESIKDVTTLDDAVKHLDTTLQAVSKEAAATVTASNNKTKALTDEEKAEKKLVETIDKAVQARSEANRAQIDANQALREAQRLTVLEQQAVNASTNSIEEMRANLSLLKNEWKGLDVGTEEFKKMSDEIRALNDRIKEAEQSTGDFRRNVGNYQSAVEGLKTLGASIDGVSKSSMGLAQGLLASNQLMGLFGTQSEESAKQAQNLQKVIALLSIAQQVNNNIIKSGTLIKIKDAAAEKLRAIQTALSTAATNASSIALGVLKKALAATGIGAVIVLLGALFANFDKIKQIIYDLIPELKGLEDSFDEIKAVLKGVGDAVINFVLTPLRTTIAFVKKLIEGDFKGAITAGLEEMKKGYDIAGNYQKGYEEQTIKNEKAAQAERAKLRAEEVEGLIKDNEAKLGSEWRYTQEAKKLYAELFAAKKVMYADDAKAAREAQREEDRYNREYFENANRRAAESAKNAADERKRAADERKKAEEEKRKAAQEALKREQERQQKTLELTRKAEDDANALTANDFERRRKETETKYDRQRQDLEKQLIAESDLTEDGRNAILSVISNIEAHKTKELDKIREDELKAEREQTEKIIKERETRLSLELERLNDFDKKLNDLQANAVARQSGGLQLIDVEVTRKNLDEVNKSIDEYIGKLETYGANEKKLHEDRLKTLEQNTPEYEAEMQKYARSAESVSERIAQAQNKQVQNTKRSTNLIFEYYRDLFTNLSEYADAAAYVWYSAFDTLSMGLQVQLDGLNEQLDGITKRYEDAQKLREESVKSVESLEKQLQTATGGTARILREQLQDSMHARAEAEREEQRLLKEKEKREAEIQKKEKQLKRAQLMSDIVTGIADTAKAAVQALSFGPPPVGIAFAAIMAALGAVQTGIMVRQLAKLEDGGELVGPSHAKGGMRIHGTNVEVEGGEYVINKKSTAANKGLLSYINGQRRELSAADLSAFFSGSAPVNTIIPNAHFADGGELPVFQNTSGVDIDYERMAEAMGNINIHPVVSVTDINSVNDEVVTVKDLAGF